MGVDERGYTRWNNKSPRMHNLMLFSDRVLVLCNFITEREFRVT